MPTNDTNIEKLRELLSRLADTIREAKGTNSAIAGEDLLDELEGCRYIKYNFSTAFSGDEVITSSSFQYPQNMPESQDTVDYFRNILTCVSKSVSTSNKTFNLITDLQHDTQGIYPNISITIPTKSELWDPSSETHATIIGHQAFRGNTYISSITIPTGFTDIWDDGFLGCTALTNITLPNTLITIGDNAFRDCLSLTSITIPDSVTSTGQMAFMSCNSLGRVNISDMVAWCNINFLGTGANPLHNGANLYLNNELTTNLTIPNTITNIKNYAFSGCTSLTNVTIPNSVTIIRNYAFSNCTSLTDITIPNSVTNIGDYTFLGCTSLTSITLPNSITWIGDSVFDSCESLTSITIPDSVTSIGNYAFEYCTSLTSITIPSSVTTIGENAFYSCSDLSSITLQQGVTTIEADAFNGTAINSITIPKSITTIGNYAFGENNFNLANATIYYDGLDYFSSDEAYLQDVVYSLYQANPDMAITVIDSNGNSRGYLCRDLFPEDPDPGSGSGSGSGNGDDNSEEEPEEDYYE